MFQKKNLYKLSASLLNLQLSEVAQNTPGALRANQEKQKLPGAERAEAPAHAEEVGATLLTPVPPLESLSTDHSIIQMTLAAKPHSQPHLCREDPLQDPLPNHQKDAFCWHKCQGDAGKLQRLEQGTGSLHCRGAWWGETGKAATP